MSPRPPRSRRPGFTTGSAAAAAAKAALLRLFDLAVPERVDIPLPDGGRLPVPVASCVEDGGGARAVVIKDGGDDPDATHGARIACLAVLVPDAQPGAVDLEGGEGVGRVTLPGLPVAVGEAAINPAPREQIARAAREAMDQAGYRGGVRLVVEAPDGARLAARTLNPRLGIIGGISILGTHGIVLPFSHEAWLATIESGLKVARATGSPTAALSTGRSSERLLMAQRPDLPPTAFVQAADHFGFSLRLAASLEFREIVWGCYFGKLVKMAEGLENTHARSGRADFARLADLAERAGATPEACRAVRQANTARHVLEILEPSGVGRRLAELVAAQAMVACRRLAGDGPELHLFCFDFAGDLLARLSTRSR